MNRTSLLIAVGLLTLASGGRAAPVPKERPKGGFLLVWTDATPLLLTPDGETTAELGHEEYGGKPGWAALSPDGKRCVIALDDGWANVTDKSLRKKYRLVVREVAEKAAGTKIESDADVVVAGAFWAQDGKRVIAEVYTLDALRAAEAAKKPLSTAEHEYRQVDLKAGAVGEPVLKLSAAESLYAARADGSWLVRAEGTGFVSVSADGKTRTELKADFPKGCYPNARAVSADGTKVLCSDLRKHETPKDQFGVLDLTTGKYTPLTLPDWPDTEKRQVLSLAVSPDGKRFAFTTQFVAGPRGIGPKAVRADYAAAVYAADIDGKNLKLLRTVETNGAAASIDWK